MRLIITFALLVMGCTSKVSEDELNHEAIILHNSMIKKARLMENRLNEIKNDSTVNQDSVIQLIQLLQQWQSDLVEVPGNEGHAHDQHFHQDHSHLDVTPEQLLEIQKELDARLSKIGKNAIQLKTP